MSESSTTTSTLDNGVQQGPREFQLVRFFARNNFTAPHILCASNCENLNMSEVESMMSDATRKLWGDLNLGYTQTPGHPALREVIATTYECDKISQRNVQVVDSNEGIYLVMRSLLKAGDRVVCTWPSFQSLSETALAQGAKVDHWEVEEGANGFFFDVDKLEELLTEPCQMVIVNFPHNPTGALPSHAEWERIVRLVSQRDAILFCDEVYRGLEYDERDRLASACTKYSKAIAVSSVSKALGLPGLRIGWLATQDLDILSKCAAYHDYCSMCCSAPSEILAIAGLENRERILSRNRDTIRKTSEALAAMLGDENIAPHFRYVRPKGGSVALVGVQAGKSAATYCDLLSDKYGVLLSSTNLFQWKDEYLRIGFGFLSGVANVEVWKKAILDGCVP